MLSPPNRKNMRGFYCGWRVLPCFFILYTSGISHNPPGFYLDQSATAISREKFNARITFIPGLARIR